MFSVAGKSRVFVLFVSVELGVVEGFILILILLGIRPFRLIYTTIADTYRGSICLGLVAAYFIRYDFDCIQLVGATKLISEVVVFVKVFGSAVELFAILRGMEGLLCLLIFVFTFHFQ